ncbi:hypothetical protein H0H92_010245 [Tricholoma furcatifolium]|nr:hypothetical protein H0H92_010245 [Tricholoma furcatifolium]
MASPPTRSRRTSSVSSPSPLNPNASPRDTLAVSPPLPNPTRTAGTASTRPRGHTTSVINFKPPFVPHPPTCSCSCISTLASPLSRVVSESSVPHVGGLTPPTPTANLPFSPPPPHHHEHSGFSVFGISLSPRRRLDSFDSGRGGYTRERKPSFGGIGGGSGGLGVPGSPGSWWGGAAWWREDHEGSSVSSLSSSCASSSCAPTLARKTTSEEHEEGLAATREVSTLGDVAREMVFMSADVLEAVPVPGLAPAARVLMQIWNAVQLVDTNRMQCLRLTERCADVLLSVREEIQEAGDSVNEELKLPISKLTETFTQIQTLLLKHTARPFLKRYLKREETAAQLKICDERLGEALVMLGVGIQIRILRCVTQGPGKSIGQKMDVTVVEMVPTKTVTANTTTNPPSLAGADTTIDAAYPSVPSSLSIDPDLDADDPARTLKALHTTQDLEDIRKDAEDLRKLIRGVLRRGPNDGEVLEMLQIGRGSGEVAEAVKALQRALERVGADVNPATTKEVEKEKGSDGKGTVRSLKWRGGKKDKEKLERKMFNTATSVSSNTSTTSNADFDDHRSIPPSLDREFLESGIDALRRLSLTSGAPPSSLSLPAWTITRYEVDRETRIGVGAFADVWRGTWRGRVVAIKVLTPTTPRELFIREVGVWKGLRHRGVLELYGASAVGEGSGPWFFVCAYMRRGSLVQFLKEVERGMNDSVGRTGNRRVCFPVQEEEGYDREYEMHAHKRHVSESTILFSQLEKNGDVVSRECDLYRFMFEVAEGMEYLHANGVLHGDLKAANVLVDDDMHCVISDFGQSEMKNEAYRLSGMVPPRGTLRWQAPELMSGETQLALTAAMDVYAFAILCVEILAMGRMPWPLLDDEAADRETEQHARPKVPDTRFNTPLMRVLLAQCWAQDPAARPPFERVVRDIDRLRSVLSSGPGGCEFTIGSAPIVIERSKNAGGGGWSCEEDGRSRLSPDMRPGPLTGLALTPPINSALIGCGHGPGLSPDSSGIEIDSTFVTAEENLSMLSASHSSLSLHKACLHVKSHHHSHQENTVASSGDPIRNSESILYTPADEYHDAEATSQASSLFSHTPSSHSLEDLGLTPGKLSTPEGTGLGCESPAPQDERIKMMLTLPLWDPSPVRLGAVGYLLKPEGRFVTLFNSFNPEKGSHLATKELPSLYGYGRVSSGSQRQDRRSAAQRGYDAFVGLLTFKGKSGTVSSQSISRRYSFPLRAGHKMACLFTETTVYRYMERLEVPKKWFKANVDSILQIYGPTHHIQKEDLFLVIGTLDAQDYSLFVSHNHPDGQAHFNVFSSPRNGHPWGMFTTDTEIPPELRGPSYDEPVSGHTVSSSKVSRNGRTWDTLLISKLRNSVYMTSCAR